MTLALIGGSGLYAFDALENTESLRNTTTWGAPSDALIKGTLHGQEVLFLARHGAGHRIPPHRVNYRANIAALVEAGADQIIATTAVGGIGPDTGSIVIPDQIIDYTYGRAHTFSDGDDAQPQHIDFTEPYSGVLRRLILAAAEEVGETVVDRGVYAATQGPRLETAAEIDRLERDGCTIVGMTGMPEAALAREAGVDYAGISLVVNPAAGRGQQMITMADIERELERGMHRIRRIIERCVTINL